MTPNELRALADALEFGPLDSRFTPPLLARKRAADYLRAQADAQPVAWSDGLGSFIAADEKVGDDPDILAYRVPLYAAPASPQAEEIDPHMLAAEDRFPDEQAEPKREPLSDGQVTDLWSWASGQDQGPETTQQHAFARAVERAAYERAAQECIETAAELRRCADGCTDGRYDWKADGADDCADAIRALGRQHD